jgi:hypothetical protein
MLWPFFLEIGKEMGTMLLQEMEGRLIGTSSWQDLRSLSRRSTADVGPDRFIEWMDGWDVHYTRIEKRGCLSMNGSDL